MKLKIAILCSDGPHHVYLLKTLRASFDVVTVIQEPAVAQRRRLLTLGRWRDYWWWTYHAWRRRLLGLDRYRSQFFLGNTSSSPANCIVGTVVDDINGDQARNVLLGDGHNFTVIMGTSILKRKLLAAIGQPAVNIHGGYLPFYRGNHCFFFALYNGDIDRLGATIHFVDDGIDTGTIIQRALVNVKANQHPEELYCLAEKEAVLQLVTLLEGVEKGIQLTGRRQSIAGRTFRMRDRKPWLDLMMWLRLQQPRFHPWLGKRIKNAE